MADLLDIVRGGPTKHVAAGHQFFIAGQHGDAMYVLIEGEVHIVLRGHVLEVVHPGGIFGEMALIDHGDRSADVVAATDATVAVIDERRFGDLVRNDPSFALDIMKIMTGRLRHIDSML